MLNLTLIRNILHGVLKIKDIFPEENERSEFNWSLPGGMPTEVTLPRRIPPGRPIKICVKSADPLLAFSNRFFHCLVSHALGRLLNSFQYPHPHV
jgi:hypothetical protein